MHLGGFVHNRNEMQDTCYRFWNRHIRLSFHTLLLFYRNLVDLYCLSQIQFWCCNQMDPASMSMRILTVSRCLVQSCTQLGEYPGWKSYKRAVHQLNPNNAERRCWDCWVVRVKPTLPPIWLPLHAFLVVLRAGSYETVSPNRRPIIIDCKWECC